MKKKTKTNEDNVDKINATYTKDYCHQLELAYGNNMMSEGTVRKEYKSLSVFVKIKSMNFELHPNFSEKGFIEDLSLCKVLLNNTLDFPWLFLIPMRPNIRHAHQLSKQDQHLLMDEIAHCSKIMEHLFKTDQLNVATIGNLTPQLHIHIIARHQQDPYWPDVIWNKPVKAMKDADLDIRINLIKEHIGTEQSFI